MCDLDSWIKMIHKMTSVAISAGSLKSGEGEKQWGREHNMDVGQERPWSERHCVGILVSLPFLAQFNVQSFLYKML